ncbi:protein-glutamate O-methyltransferase CheR [Pelotomaculum isophthalicicum JI]|uniref:Protein-glutamate O-methyltransferase CheR n=1 Tax=Pelotomaculum isophthalicicum JI TaxID=947010 RepID=A0A9X4JTU7_9FIRM|nr:protein-glutamate O-methyltransferase CheR [Pelotomaculum isophthalicicum]MDF9409324.1 protein-glutamate O-methyltransferase CheR [Pelotomaculum isophthalicicum JI]
MDFSLFKDRIRSNFKLDLNAYKENQLKRRLDSLMTKQKINNGDYAGFFKLLNSDRKAYTDFLDTVTINVSEFFRDKSMFSVLEEKVMPMLLEKGALKVWSAACSNGAEPYSIAIILHELSPNRRHQIEGTDLDRNILQAAADACYNQDQVRNVSGPRLDKYFRKEGNMYYLHDNIKNMVNLRQHDLLLDQYGQSYDLIACRNVMIYFTREAQDVLNNKFVKALKPGGVLFIGASEMIFNYKELGLEKIASCYYLRK